MRGPRAGRLLLFGLAVAGTPSVTAAQPAPSAASQVLDDPRMPGVPFEELQRRASEAWAAGRLDEAFRFYRAGVELNPLWHEGWFYIGSIHYAKGRFDRARTALRRVVEAVPGSGPAWVLLGFSEFQLAEYDRALAALSQGLSLGLEGSEDIEAGAHHHLALLKIRRGDFEGSVQDLLWLARSQPPSPPLLDACGLMILRRPTLPSEIPEEEKDLVKTAGWAAYSTLAGRHDEARPLFEDLVARYPDTPGVHLAFGLFLSARGSDQALAMLNKEVEISPDNARAHLEVAFQHLERGDAVDALPSARAAVRISPDVYTSHLALGRALVARNELAQGLTELEEAARLGPEVSAVYLALAQAYARAGRPEDVERARQKLLELDAQNQPSQSR
ncbi:MAG: tetratricopeptide repeat protein [Acidobacteria bacterium]|nr:tetratricopeptide repeat protein [Acidobacteriota bacterium]